MARALGKGLSQLLGEEAESFTLEVPVGAIVPNRRQPRTRFNQEAVNELAASIREVGILQPLVVRPLSEGKYELIAGERRLRAAKLAGLEAVPVLVRAADDQGSLELALVENLQREDISPLEAAKAYRKLIDEFKLTQEAVADKVGKSRVAVANTVRLLRLPERALQALEEGMVTEAHARALLGFPNQALQLAVLNQILKKNLTVKEVEKLATKLGAQVGKVRRRSREELDPNWLAFQDTLSTTLGAPVRLEKTEKGGRIVIEFYSEDDLMRISELLGA